MSRVVEILMWQVKFTFFSEIGPFKKALHLKELNCLLVYVDACFQCENTKPMLADRPTDYSKHSCMHSEG